MNLKHITQIIVIWGQRLTNPSDTITVSEERHRARFLSAVLLVGIFLDILVVSTRLLATSFSIMTIVLGSTSFIAFVGAYATSRTKYHKKVAIFLVFVISVYSYIGAIADLSFSFALNYIGLASLITIILLTPQIAARIIITNLVIILGLFFVLPDWNIQTVGDEAAYLITSTAAIFVVLQVLNRQSQELIAVEKERYELELRNEQAKLLSSFIKDVSHEFKTPLSIIGTSSYILRKRLESDTLFTQIEKIETAQQNIDDLVDTLMKMAKLDETYLTVMSPIDLNGLIRSVASGLQSELEEKSINLSLQLDSRNPTIIGDESWIMHAVKNLLDNAIRYTYENNPISIVTSCQGDSAIIEVKDQGLGVTQDDLPYIFDRFYRADEARTSRGLGLGLTIADRIIELHNGKIEVDSKLGEGSTFRVILPLKHAQRIDDGKSISNNLAMVQIR